MHPYFYIFGHTISGYALMGLIGFGAVIIFILLECRRKGFSFDDAAYLLALSMIGMIIGAKSLYIVTVIPEIIGNWNQIVTNPITYVKAYLSGGMVFYGGLFGSILAAKKAASYFHIHLATHYDIFIPAIPLFAGFGRLGCFMEGCCFGKKTGHYPYIIFRSSLFAPNNVPLIPTQLYEAVFDFFLFFVLLYLGSKKDYVSKLLDIYLVVYALFRFVIEFFRGDSVRGIFLLSTSQWISIMILCFFTLWCLRSRKQRT